MYIVVLEGEEPDLYHAWCASGTLSIVPDQTIKAVINNLPKTNNIVPDQTVPIRAVLSEPILFVLRFLFWHHMS